MVKSVQSSSLSAWHFVGTMVLPCDPIRFVCKETGPPLLYPPPPAAVPGLGSSDGLLTRSFGAVHRNGRRPEHSLTISFLALSGTRISKRFQVSLQHFHFSETVEFKISLQSLLMSAETQTPILTLLDLSYLCAHTQIILLWRMKAPEKQAPLTKSDFAHLFSSHQILRGVKEGSDGAALSSEIVHQLQ